MQKKQVTVLVRLKAKEGMAERLQEAAMNLIPLTRREPGCIDYYFHIDANNANAFMFYENWIDHEALGEHLEKPYLKEFERLLDHILAEKEEFTFWKILE